MIEEALRSKLRITAIGALDAIPDLPEGWSHAAFFQFTAPLMKSLSDVETSQGILALVERPQPSRGFVDAESAFILVLDGLQDPGNVGALFRTAEAAGVSGVLLTRGCADPFSPKALRASAGSAFRLPHVRDLSHAELLTLLPARVRLVAAVSKAEASSVFDAPLSLPLALALGSEGSGLDSRLESASVARLRVPSANPVESLNVAAAGAIVMFEISRRAGLI